MGNYKLLWNIRQSRFIVTYRNDVRSWCKIPAARGVRQGRGIPHVLLNLCLKNKGARGSVLVKALWHMLEGRGFETL
jgi:hypothetical protein